MICVVCISFCFVSYSIDVFDSYLTYADLDRTVRLEPTLIELEREKEDLLIIGHASVIRCMLAYLIGLPASEIPAIVPTWREAFRA